MQDKQNIQLNSGSLFCHHDGKEAPTHLNFLLAGSVAGIVEHCVVFPIDTIKVRCIFDCSHIDVLASLFSFLHHSFSGMSFFPICFAVPEKIIMKPLCSRLICNPTNPPLEIPSQKQALLWSKTVESNVCFVDSPSLYSVQVFHSFPRPISYRSC